MKSLNRQFKDDTYEQLARIGKAVSSPKRLELLELDEFFRVVEVLLNYPEFIGDYLLLSNFPWPP